MEGLFSIAERLVWLRESRRLERPFAAKETGVSLTSIRNHEKGTWIPSERILRTYAMFYGCDPEWLETGQGEPPTPGARPVTAEPRRGGASEGGTAYRRPTERMLAEGELVDVTQYEPATEAMQTVARLVGMLEKKDCEIEELRRRLEAAEKRNTEEPDEKTGSSAAM